MACPHAAGVAALCLAQDGNMTPDEVGWLIRNSADDLGDAGWDEYYGSGRINAYNALYGITNAPSKATNPFPETDANGQSVNVDLSWTPASGALSHNVYLGTDGNDVNDANTSSPEFKRNIFPFFFDANTMEPNTTYYWRIDEKNNEGTTKGDLWTFTTGSNSGIFYVDANAAGGGDGDSWGTAFNDLQDALACVWSGDEIWAAQGTYKPTDGNDRSISFELPQYAALYGGFAGTETSRDQRDWTVYETILTGDINQPNDQNDNSYHVVIGADKTILDGFTIKGGNADAPSPDNRGAGIYNFVVSFSNIRNCMIIDNNSTNVGGGMYNSYASSCTVSACTFAGNSALQGGGMYNVNSSDVTVSGCTFAGNSACSGGGAHNVNNAGITVSGCKFTDNCSSASGGGMYLRHQDYSIIVNCTFTGNEAATRGGGIMCLTSDPFDITNCIFWDNDADSTADEIWGQGSSRHAKPNISYCDIKGCGGSGDGWDPNCGTDGGSNIDSDPCFVNADANDFHLALDSPCIDAGDPNGDYDGQVDIDGDVRVMCTVDIGADEVECFPADYNDYDDWVGMGQPDCWCYCWPYQCDGDADGAATADANEYRVSQADLDVLAANWMKKIDDATLNPCADIDHKAYRKGFRVFAGDLAILSANWQKKDADLDGDCPRDE
ncbi:MAG: S8 family serine peptidase [Phycisphaerae bacterium]|nr:S8 family serine peptidase [Phycisphaerae bacterium]